MEEQIKFTEDEVKQINQLRFDVGSVFTQLGQIQIEKKKRLEELEENEANLLIQYKELVAKEDTLFKELNEKYGDGDYDPNTGIFTPIQK
jgi:predicted transcriptional regulator